jgi:crotonobetainyl-CoA:carnitine CoA-transferase CaiB-like acyl-CoA transferase
MIVDFQAGRPFGQDGPYSARAGYDAMIQAMSGIMDITGDPDGEPQKIGVALADILTGVYGTALAMHTRTSCRTRPSRRATGT